MSEKLDRFNKIQAVVCLCVWYWDIHVISMIIIRHFRTPCKTTSIIYNFFVLMKHFSRHLKRGRTYVKLTMLNYTSIHIQTEILWMEAAKKDCFTQLNAISLLLTDIYRWVVDGCIIRSIRTGCKNSIVTNALKWIKSEKSFINVSPPFIHTCEILLNVLFHTQLFNVR